MNEFDFDLVLLETTSDMEHVISDYQNNMAKLSVGRANPNVLASLKVFYYETWTPLDQICAISIPEPRQLIVKPFDRNLAKDVVSVINGSGLDITASNEGDKVRVTFPELTTERRRDLVKHLGTYTEQARVAIRNVRHDANKKIKNAELPEDIEKNYLEEIQKLTNKFNETISSLASEKENSLMKV